LRFLLRDCEKMLSERCASARIAFRLDEPDTPVLVPGERAKLRQAFLNLLSNAVKFTEAGGSVTVFLREESDSVVAEIADTGIGMTRADVEIALTPFGQVDSRLERKYDGTGLGLPLAKSLVELHGGALEIESEKGVGTTVRVRLPREGAAEMPQAAAAVS
jgi:signal transduction histidine kinase